MTDLLEKIEHAPALQPQRDRQAFLDGLRGCAALFVAICHAYFQLNWRRDGGGLSHYVELPTRILSAGGYGVAAFIVLSGYCLMLPVARSTDGRLRGGTLFYLLRRCKRIMPAYYAALFISVLLIWSIPGLSVHPACFADAATPITTGGLISHLFLVHEVREGWNLNIDPPMWTVAVEFQIYFLLPLFFLPVYRKWGATAALIAGYLLVIAINVGTGSPYVARFTHYIGLFALGVFAAEITSGHGAQVPRLRKLPWGVIGIIGLIAAFLLAISDPTWAPRAGWAPHALFGVATVGLLICCALKRSGGVMLRHLLELKPLVWLGSFSYSLYLIHMPVEGVLFYLLKHWVAWPDLLLAINLFVCVPIVTLICYGFYWCFERPFLGNPIVHK